MKQLPTANISIVTLGVESLVLATEFYKNLGWANTTASQESVTFLQGHSVVLGLYGRQALAHDAGVENTPAGFRGCNVAINLKSEALVDEFFAHALSIGATEIKRPEKVFWGGYSGYFADLDGHFWEIAYNPFFSGDAETGRLKLEVLS